MTRSRVPVKGSIGKSIRTGQSSTVVNNTTVVQQRSGSTAGVGTVSVAIWPLIQQIPPTVLDLAALSTPGVAVFDGTDLITRTITGTTDVIVTNGTGAAGDPTIDVSAAVKATLALAATAVQPTRTITAGTGLTGGGDLSADRTIALNSTSIADLALAATAVQPGSLAAIATSGSASDLTSGTVPSAALPVASTSVLGAVKVDGTTITITGDVISAVGGGGSSPLTTKGDIYGFNTAAARIPVGTDGQVLTADSSAALGVSYQAVGGTGTVTSVALTMPSSLFNISGSPITGAGTLAVTFATQTAGLVFAGPATGSAAVPTFRALATTDLPALGANPSATIGLAAVNGTAGTYVRSDGAPALSQAIAPTWTGTHSFTGVPNINRSVSGISIGLANSTNTEMTFILAGAGTDEKVWDITTSSGSNSLLMRAVNDANTAAANWLEVDRTGITIDKVKFGGPLQSTAYTVGSLVSDASGNITVGSPFPAGAPVSVPNLLYWIDCSVLPLAASSLVQILPSGNPQLAPVFFTSASTGLAGGGATISTSALNGRPNITLPGSTLGRYLPEGWVSGAAFTQQMTLFAVMRPTSIASFDLISGPTGSMDIQCTGGTVQLIETNIAVHANSSAPLVVNTWQQLMIQWNNTSGAYAFRVARTAAGSGTSSAFGSTSLPVNAAFYNIQNSTGDYAGGFAELLMYNRVLTSPEIATVEAYLLAKWGV